MLEGELLRRKAIEAEMGESFIAIGIYWGKFFHMCKILSYLFLWMYSDMIVFVFFAF